MVRLLVRIFGTYVGTYIWIRILVRIFGTYMVRTSVEEVEPRRALVSEERQRRLFRL